jgi:hypothetical protein
MLARASLSLYIYIPETICVLLYFFALFHDNNPARDLDAAMFVATCLQVMVWLVAHGYITYVFSDRLVDDIVISFRKRLHLLWFNYVLEE